MAEDSDYREWAVNALLARANDERSARLNKRSAYQAAEAHLRETERYLESFEGDSRPHIPELVQATRQNIRTIRDCLEHDAAELVLAAQEATGDKKEKSSTLLEVTADQATPEHLVLYMNSLHQALFRLQIAAAMPTEQLDKLADALGGEITLGVHELASSPDQLQELLRAALDQRANLAMAQQDSVKAKGTTAQMRESVEHRLLANRQQSWTQATEKVGSEFGITGAQVRNRLRDEYGLNGAWAKRLQRDR
jgi:hypothetical protein